MTLLTMVSDVADEVGTDDVSAVIGNADPVVKRYLRIINKVGIRLMKTVPWQVLRKEHTFTSVAAEDQASATPIPTDFHRFVPETCWDRTNIVMMSGPINPVQWQGLKANSFDDIRRKFIRRGNSFLVIPAFDAGNTVAYEYIKNTWCESSAAAAQNVFAADNDVSRISEELLTLGLKAAYLMSEQFPFQDALAEFMKALKLEVKQDQNRPQVLAAGDIFANSAARHFEGTPQTAGASSVI